MTRELDHAIAVHVFDLPRSTVGVVPYSSDLNACAQAEARIIERGLGRHYAEWVGAELDKELLVGQRDYEYVDFDAVAHMVTAPAELRCRAMLLTVEEAAWRAQVQQRSGGWRSVPYVFVLDLPFDPPGGLR